MKTMIKLSLTMAVLLMATAATATEGLSPIAYGAQTQGMGGVGIGMMHGAESSLSNPALIGYLKNNSASLGTSYMTIDSKYKSNSDSGTFDTEPALNSYGALSSSITDSVSIGAAFTNMNTLNSSIDDDGAFALSQVAKSRVLIPVSYNIAGFSIGIAPILENQSMGLFGVLATNPSTAFGFDIGLAYDLPSWGVIVGVDYKSKIKHSYDLDGDNFNVNTPSEIGVGVSWDVLNTGHTIALDYKKVDTSAFFEISDENTDLGLNDINVFALGYQYEAEGWAVRAGYRYISDLYESKAEELIYIFPYNTSSHFTLGGSYALSDSISGDLAISYAISDKDYSYNDGDSFNMKNSQMALTLGVNYSF